MVREYLVQPFKYTKDGGKGAAPDEGRVLEALLFSIYFPDIGRLDPGLLGGHELKLDFQNTVDSGLVLC